MTFYVISGSTLGTAEAAAESIVEEYNQQHPETPAKVLHSPSLEAIADATRLVVVCASYGAGEFPDSFYPLAQQIEKADKPFPQLEKLLLIGVGSSDYDTFNGAIDLLANIFAAKDIHPVATPAKIDIVETFEPDVAAVDYFNLHADEFLA
ncbi:flavodoxin domain-containing protein [Psittacicella hinzii]|uniref:Flavodoxin-like domain-containing protein n=1 Tax=Psittacicella hinzii TaxID=2028575 RepID=A0A3A1YLL7_9GAMM|nr:flavodoxin domain-containing protein [Psittacicella hinzii]RIY39183.1 hypothetical protein CKF58_02625 [Psittacicella hinzii]